MENKFFDKKNPASQIISIKHPILQEEMFKKKTR